ncbi:MAG: peptide chain release factor N(5)-glutamine methyltransferase [Pseudomonadota bacterium]
MVDRSFFLDRTLTVAEASSRVMQALEHAGVENAGVEARQLLVEAAGLQREDIILRPQMILGKLQQQSVLEWLERRAGGEPLSRIRGWQEFYGRRFALSAATLEPRADSETLIDAAFELTNMHRGHHAPLRILDVGTGTGCLALTLLAEWPNATATAVDICANTLHAARDNAVALGLDNRMTWLQSNYLENVEETFDLVISNPPYIKRDEIQALQVEVLQHDPYVALDGGKDGLAAYRIIATSLLNVIPKGFVILEIACNDATRVIDAMQTCINDSRVKVAGVWQDLSGCERSIALRNCLEGYRTLTA